MTCIFCHAWNQSDPNCGHYLLNGVHMPSLTATRADRAFEMFGGGRAWRYADAENRGTEYSRTEFVVRLAAHALSGGWG